MNRKDFEKYITENFVSVSDYPWMQHPDFEVFRHESNKKWFALVMNISARCLGLSDDRMIDVVNFKSDPFLIGSLLEEEGIYPAYHMSKAHWITAALDGSASDDTIEMLVEISYDLTLPGK